VALVTGEPEITGALGVISRLQIREEAEGVPCCHDLTGDGEPDNMLAMLVKLADQAVSGEVSTDIEGRALQRSIDKGWKHHLVELLEHPGEDECGPVRVQWWPATRDLDYNGYPESSVRALQAGEASFRVLPGGLTAEGVPHQLNRAALDDDGVLRAEGASLDFDFVMPDGSMMHLPAYGVRIEGPVVLEDDVIRSVDEEVGEEIVGGLKLSGYVPMSAIGDYFVSQAQACTCLDVDREEPVVEYGIDEGEFWVKCAQRDDDSWDHCDWRTEPWVCYAFRDVCKVLPVVHSLADVSTGVEGEDGTTAKDALSFGVRASLAGASLDETPFTPPVVAFGERFKIEAGAEAFRMDVLRNDVDSVSSELAVAGVATPLFGVATIAEEGKAITYEPAASWAGIEEFTYTIGEGANAAEGTVRVTAPEQSWNVILLDDEYTMPLNRGPATFAVLENDDLGGTEPGFFHIWRPYNQTADNVRLGLDADRQKVVVRSIDPELNEQTFELKYSVALTEGTTYGEATVTVHLERPEPECGDGWHDHWAEGCDDGNTDSGDGCDADCQLESCPGGADPTPWYEDADTDGYGDPATIMYACDFPGGTKTGEAGDCDDSNRDVNADGVEFVAGTCGDGLDNDCDGFTDCGELSCMGKVPCVEKDCGDGVDDDGDGTTDCDDRDCTYVGGCSEALCDDGVDNDGDGMTDCWEATCFWFTHCQEGKCNDELDNDGDGVYDCDDDDCRHFEYCR